MKKTTKLPPPRRAWALALSIAALLVAPPSKAADVILNEYNAVASAKWLGNPNLPECDGPAGADCATAKDTFFGRVMGNGGNWFELVVITDHLDMRGWSLYWEEVGNLKEGTIFLSQDLFWSDLRAGTILTFTELTAAEGGLDTDLSFDPCSGDWWVNVNSFDTALVPTTDTNVVGDGPGNFSVGNDDWRLTVLDASGGTVFGPAGEGSPLYPGSNANSREVVGLEADPTATVGPGSNYDDGTRSTFGSFNTWKDALGCRLYQETSPLRSAEEALCSNCTPLLLNEYNAVDEAAFLNGGDALLDADGGMASDLFFGRVMGNGGDWFELVVIEDGLDLREASLEWQSANGESGAIQLSADGFWASLASGTIVTFTEWTAAEGGADTDLSLDPGAGDPSVNVNTFDTQLVASTTGSAPGHLSGEFDVDAEDWSLTLRDGGGNLLFGPVGEGSIYYYQDNVSDTNIFRLEADPSSTTRALGLYDDGSSGSTFGAVNDWTVCPSATPVMQSLAALPDCQEALVLTIGGVCPGVSTIDVTGATASGGVGLLFGTEGGTTVLQGGPCSGAVLPLGGATLITVPTADAGGEVSLSPDIGSPAICGTPLVAVDAGSCRVSNTDSIAQ